MDRVLLDTDIVSEILKRYDVVGPVCETADYLGLDRELAVEGGELLAVLRAGAYGATMSANYNTRPRAPEVMVDGVGATSCASSKRSRIGCASNRWARSDWSPDPSAAGLAI